MMNNILDLAATASAYFCAFALTAAYGAAVNDAQDVSTTNNSNDGGPDLMPGILLALPGGIAGDSTLQSWSRWAEDVQTSGSASSPIWIICHNMTTEKNVLEVPNVSPFVVEEGWSWAVTLEAFMSQNHELPAVGLLGEGTLPNPALAESIESMHLALAGAKPPTAILTRSHSRDRGGNRDDGNWLSDKFVSQLWCNRAVLQGSRLVEAGLPSRVVEDTPLLVVLPELIRNRVNLRHGSNHELVLVDGTHVLRSNFDSVTETQQTSSAAASQTPPAGTKGSGGVYLGEKGVDVYIGSLDYALVFAGRGGHLPGDRRGRTEDDSVRVSTISKAPWPPVYVLETVAAGATEESKGLVLVSNVNCGYLDMATNFWSSVRRTSSAKVRRRYGMMCY